MKTLRLLPLAALALAMPAAAQTSAPAVIDACYVPISGTIYRINTTASPAPGAPAGCTTPTHVRFQFVQASGALGPDLTLPGKLNMGGSGQFGSSLLAGDAPMDLSTLPAGAGTRMLWVGPRAALRAGAVTDDRWSVAQIGDGSIGLGRQTRASGMDGVAIGFNAQAVHPGALVLSAGALGGPVVASSRDNEATVRAVGGIRLRTSNDLTRGCDVDTSGRLTCTGGVDGGVAGVSQVSTTATVVSDDLKGASGDAVALCPTGATVTGGGVSTQGGDAKVRESYPLTLLNGVQGWAATVRNDMPFSTTTIRVTAICLRVN